ncbi:whey acidic protein-like [Bombina bombina]|uniref:whey acidic protein-like n=1 Tax=Bombina bombina TaxID=8345 RepID=UPI00235B2E8E|nr:whey acidic protein-like [Bombina bombina]
MLRVVLVSAFFAVSLAHKDLKNAFDTSSSEEEEDGLKQGHCPIDISGNSSLAACPSSCSNGTNCSDLDCSSHTNCTGIQKCCATSCGMKCLDPAYKICRTDEDCSNNLICCRKRCVSVCVTPKPYLALKKNGKGLKAKLK